MVLEAARAAGTGHVVVASSSSVYGANPTLPKHEDLAQLPLSPYAASKLATEGYALAYQHSYGLPVLAFRFFNVFGPLPGGRARVRRGGAGVRRGGPRRPPDPGARRRHAVARLHLRRHRHRGDRATRWRARSCTRSPVNLAFGTRTDLVTLIEMLEEVLGRPLAREHGPRRAGDVDHSRADDTRSARRSSPTSSRRRCPTRCAATVAWYRAGARVRWLTPASRTTRRSACSTSRWPGPGSWCSRPLLLVIALAVRLRMGSPVLFRQTRPGRGGRPFELLKFRTMTDRRGPDGELLPDAERLTWVGRVLRKTSLDELPELVNVLRGDMSLVGPRPLLVEYLDLYSPRAGPPPRRAARHHGLGPGERAQRDVVGRAVRARPVLRGTPIDATRPPHPQAHGRAGAHRCRRVAARRGDDGPLHRFRGPGR